MIYFMGYNIYSVETHRISFLCIPIDFNVKYCNNFFLIGVNSLEIENGIVTMTIPFSYSHFLNNSLFFNSCCFINSDCTSFTGSGL